MWKILAFSYRNHRFVFPILLLISVVLGTFALHVEIDLSSDNLVSPSNPLKRDYEAVKAEFGSDRIGTVFVEDRSLFTPEKLGILKKLNNELSALNGVQRIESLFTLNHIVGRDDWLETGPLLESLPETPEEAETKRREAVNNVLLRNVVISKDGQATVFNLYLDEDKDDDTDAFDREFVETVDAVLKSYESSFSRIYQIGAPSLKLRMRDYVVSDQKILLPLSAILLILLIGVTMQNIHGAVIPLANAVISCIWILGIMGILGIPINMLNYVVPALILVVGATEDVHFITEFLEQRSQGNNGMESITAASRRVGLPLLLTALTTFLGFGATGITEIPIMRQFAITAALGIVVRFAMTLILTPAYLHFVVDREKPEKGNKLRRPEWSEKMANRFTDFVMGKLVKRPTLLISCVAVIIIPSLFFSTRITLNNDLLAFLKKDAVALQQIQRASFKLSGSKVVYLTIQGNPGDFKTAKSLRKIHEIVNSLRQFKEFDKITSLADYLSLVNQEMHGGDTEFAYIPENDALIAQYLLFFHRRDLSTFVNRDYSKANIVLRTQLKDSTKLNAVISDIRNRLDQGWFGPILYTLTGNSVLVSDAVDEIARGQTISLSSVTAMLFFIVSAIFISLRLGFLAVLSNLFYVVILFGVMGLASIPLNVGTCMIAAITVGIGIDNTLHLMVRYNQELKSVKDEKKAIDLTLRAEFLPVVVTSLGLAGGFFILGYSSFVPVQQFGILSALVIVLAAFADLVITPVLLSQTRLITLWDMIGINVRKVLMETSPLFQGMTSWQVKKLILFSHLANFKAGQTIIEDGEWGDLMYVVIEGELEVSKTIKGEKRVLAPLEAGAVFGEIALISRTRRSADVIARSDAKLLTLDWDSLAKIQRFSPFLASRIYLNLSRVLGQRLVETSEKVSS